MGRRSQVNIDVHTTLVLLVTGMTKMQGDVVEARRQGLLILFLNQGNQEKEKSCRAVSELRERHIGMVRQWSTVMRPTHWLSS